jgi:uncharacterized protein YceH (UPF0502 family)
MENATASLSPATPQLSELEIRILGVLVEKQRTVPDTYPLTLNALVGGCNQKTSRDPILSVTDAEVQAALDRLKSGAWIVESSGGRVMRYAHNIERVLSIPSQSSALLAVLMLRGPQTAGELRINCDRLHRFADISAVEAFLHELAARPAGALVVELPRTPGTRETRWAHLLAGTPPALPPPITEQPRHGETGSAAEIAEIRDALAVLQSDVAALKSTLIALCAKVGVAPP